jgi:hypothetical protein
VVNVERPVTIAVAGTHSTGKSTFLARLAHVLRREGIEVATVADLAEQAHRTGLPILHAHNYSSTLWIMARGISEELATWPHADVLLVDRPVPDALGYYLAALAYRGETPDPTAIEHLSALARHHSAHYDLVMRTVLDQDIPIGEGRDRTTGIGASPTTTSNAFSINSISVTSCCSQINTIQNSNASPTSRSIGCAASPPLDSERPAALHGDRSTPFPVDSERCSTMAGDRPTNEPDQIRSAIWFIATQLGGAQRVLAHHSKTSNGLCSACSSVRPVRWPCSIASMALQAKVQHDRPEGRERDPM